MLFLLANASPVALAKSGEFEAVADHLKTKYEAKKVSIPFMVTTLAPCWYCSGLIRQFNIGTVVVGESATFAGGIDWLRENGVEVYDLNSAECIAMMREFIANHPALWNEDIGED